MKQGKCEADYTGFVRGSWRDNNVLTFGRRQEETMGKEPMTVRDLLDKVLIYGKPKRFTNGKPEIHTVRIVCTGTGMLLDLEVDSLSQQDGIIEIVAKGRIDKI